jgi:hypothetical protein
MDASWVTAGLAAIGIVGQLMIGFKNSGARDEKLRTLGREMREQKDLSTEHGKQIADHDRKIVRIETILQQGSGD